MHLPANRAGIRIDRIEKASLVADIDDVGFKRKRGARTASRPHLRRECDRDLDTANSLEAIDRRAVRVRVGLAVGEGARKDGQIESVDTDPLECWMKALSANCTLKEP